MALCDFISTVMLVPRTIGMLMRPERMIMRGRMIMSTAGVIVMIVLVMISRGKMNMRS